MHSVVLVDTAILLGCSAALLTRPWLRMSHPGALYLLFHALVVTQRGWALTQGGRPTFFGVPLVEVEYAVVAADALLVSLTLGWLYSGSKPSTGRAGEDWRRSFDGRSLLWVSIFFVPLGVYALLQVGFVPGVQSSAVVRGSYLEYAIVWPAICGIALMYHYGYRWYLLWPTVGYIGLMAFQGFGRFRLILPLVLVLLVALERSDRRWPRGWMIVLAAAVGVLFVPMKSVAFQLQDGSLTLAEVRSALAESYSETSSGVSNEQQILDQAAIVLYRSDETGHLLLGEPYLKAAFFLVPRDLWPQKPHLGEHIRDLSSPAYPLGEVGSVSTLVGDMYLNFRWVGLAVGGFVFAAISGALHRRAYETPPGSYQRLLAISAAVVLIQVYRDGILSLVLFLTLTMLPILLVGLMQHLKSEPSRLLQAS